MKKIKVLFFIGSFIVGMAFLTFSNQAKACDTATDNDGFCGDDDVCAYIATNQDCKLPDLEKESLEIR